jgi:signal transduction histidine kinase
LRYGSVAHVTLRNQGDMAEVIVDDEGPGISPSRREAVFRTFHRAESSRNRSTGRSGLGPAVALSIIERQHHSGIEIDAHPAGKLDLKFASRESMLDSGAACRVKRAACGFESAVQLTSA